MMQKRFGRIIIALATAAAIALASAGEAQARRIRHRGSGTGRYRVERSYRPIAYQSRQRAYRPVAYQRSRQDYRPVSYQPQALPRALPRALPPVAYQSPRPTYQPQAQPPVGFQRPPYRHVSYQVPDYRDWKTKVWHRWNQIEPQKNPAILTERRLAQFEKEIARPQSRKAMHSYLGTPSFSGPEEEIWTIQRLGMDGTPSGKYSQFRAIYKNGKVFWWTTDW